MQHLTKFHRDTWKHIVHLTEQTNDNNLCYCHSDQQRFLIFLKQIFDSPTMARLHLYQTMSKEKFSDVLELPGSQLYSSTKKNSYSDTEIDQLQWFLNKEYATHVAVITAPPRATHLLGLNIRSLAEGCSHFLRVREMLISGKRKM